MQRLWRMPSLIILGRKSERQDARDNSLKALISPILLFFVELITMTINVKNAEQFRQ